MVVLTSCSNAGSEALATDRKTAPRTKGPAMRRVTPSPTWMLPSAERYYFRKEMSDEVDMPGHGCRDVVRWSPCSRANCNERNNRQWAEGDSVARRDLEVRVCGGRLTTGGSSVLQETKDGDGSPDP